MPSLLYTLLQEHEHTHIYGHMHWHKKDENSRSHYVWSYIYYGGFDLFTWEKKSLSAQD
jgi:hypothetical protein